MQILPALGWFVLKQTSEGIGAKLIYIEFFSLVDSKTNKKWCYCWRSLICFEGIWSWCPFQLYRMHWVFAAKLVLRLNPVVIESSECFRTKPLALGTGGILFVFWWLMKAVCISLDTTPFTFVLYIRSLKAEDFPNLPAFCSADRYPVDTLSYCRLWIHPFASSLSECCVFLSLFIPSFCALRIRDTIIGTCYFAKIWNSDSSSFSSSLLFFFLAIRVVV